MRPGATGRHRLTTVAGMRCYCHALHGLDALPMPRTYHVYIMASLGGALYIGITGNLQRRVQEHKHDLLAGFTRRYRVHRLVYVEGTPDVRDAIAREKQLKGWTRRRKVELIESANPHWNDLAAQW